MALVQSFGYTGPTYGSTTAGLPPPKPPTAPTSLSGAAAAAEEERKRLLAEYQNYQTRTAPTVTAPVMGGPSTVAGTTITAPKPVTASTIGVAPTIEAGQAQAGPQVEAAKVEAGGVGATYLPPARTVQGATIERTAGIQYTPMVAGYRLAAPAQVGPAQIAATAPANARAVEATQIAMDDQAQLRARQLALLNRLEATAAGTGGPGAAELQLQRSTDKAVARQIGLTRAAAARTGAPGLALREGQQDIAALEADANLAAAQLRAEEAERARQGLISTVTGARGQDIGLAGEQAKLTAGARTTTAELGTRVDLANLDVRAREALEQARLEQEATQAGAERGLKTELAQGDITLRGQLANQATSVEAQKANAMLEAQRAAEQARLTQAAATTTATLGQESDITQSKLAQERNLTAAELATKTALANAENTLRASMSNSEIEARRQATNAQLTTQTNIANAENNLQTMLEQAKLSQAAGTVNAELEAKINTANAQLDAQRQEFNATVANTFQKDAATFGFETALANQKALIETMGLDDAQKGRLLDAYANAAKLYVDAEATRLGLDAQRRQQNMALIGSIFGAVAPVVAKAAVSDRRLKTDVKPLASASAGPKSRTDAIAFMKRQAGGGDPLGEFLDSLEAYSYRYKDPRRDGEGPRVGVMAQDLERTPVGKTMVKEDARGAKVIDVAAATGVLLAAMSKMRGQQNELIEALKARRAAGKRKAA